jgi:hypothetical protein
VSVQTSLCSIQDFFFSKVYSTGSSIEIICFEKLEFILSIIAAIVVDFQDQVTQQTKTIQEFLSDNSFKTSGTQSASKDFISDLKYLKVADGFFA